MTEQQQYPLARKFLSEIWSSLQGDQRWADLVEFADGGSMGSVFNGTDLAAATFGACGAAVSELVGAVASSPPDVRVSRTMASEWFRMPPIAPSWPLNPPDDFAVPTLGTSERDSVLSAIFPVNVWSNSYQTADGRWLFLRAGGDKALKVLGVDEDYDQVAAAILAGNADELEQAIVDVGGVASANRTIEQWLAHPQGLAVNAEPIVDVRYTDRGADEWQPTPGRPLAGVRVLDLTRVLAGPLATRFLAACGAEVLRLDAPGSMESELSHTLDWGDVMLGKRWSYLDLSTGGGRDRFLELLAEADVLVHGYRPGGIDSFVDQATRSAARPGLVEVSLNAYGWTGPWKMRRGYDMATQWSTGICDANSAWALERPEKRLPINALGRLVDASRPRHMPVEILDFSTAYQIAAAAVRGLTHRLHTGEGSVSRLSLARTAALLISGGRATDEQTIPIPLNGPFEDAIFAVNGRPTRRLIWPLSITDNKLFWERQCERAGGSTPTWSTSRSIQ